MPQIVSFAAGAALALALFAAPVAQAQNNVLRVVPHADLTLLDPGWSPIVITRQYGLMVYEQLFAWDSKLEAKPQMTPAAIRAHYLRRLMDPRAVLRLLTGKVKVSQMAGSLIEAAKPAPPPTSLAQDMAAGLAQFSGPATLLVAESDRTGQVFLSHWNKADQRIRICPKAGHSFVEPQARIWLQGQLLGALRSAS